MGRRKSKNPIDGKERSRRWRQTKRETGYIERSIMITAENAERVERLTKLRKTSLAALINDLIAEAPLPS